jgi:tetratricopeptide (TPR) repeat protein/predicted Ser/Thr protein kinase
MMNSTSVRDEQVMTLLAAALTLPGDARSDYLQAACQGDDELLHETRDALEWEERMGGFLRKPWMALQDLERPFKPGQVVNHRFEIIREIGEGGMGVVYEAFDRKRGQRIAFKSAKLGFRRLLSPELESALKVRHRNICLVNEIHTAATEYGEIDFLTMELLDGPTLQARLSSGERMERQEVLEIAQQLCAGLAEAHRIGIIHKDLKSANVILSHLPDGTPRAVITDFGLAGEPALASEDLAGTPQYMAPELWQGAPASKASDIYALGVILYEMVAGSRPFEDQPSQSRLTMRPPPPTARGRTLDKHWDAVILQCLDPSPEARPSDATEVSAALGKRTFRKAPLVAALVLLALGGLAIPKCFAPANVRLAILPVEGAADVSAIGDGALLDVADRLRLRTGAPTVVVIPASRSLDSNVHTPEQASQTLHATHALQIALRKEGNDLVAQGAVIDLDTQTTLYEFSGRYPVANAGDLAPALTGAVSRALRLKGIVGEPITRAAAPPYWQGLAYLRRDQRSFDQAIPLFRQAMQADPHSALPRAGLVEALVLKYEDTKQGQWIEEAARTLKTAEALSPDSVAVLLAGGRFEKSQSHYEDALQNYERVKELQPRNVEVLLRIAEIDNSMSHGKEAIDNYRAAILLDPGYYETYEEFGVFYYQQGEYARAAEQFRKVIEHAPRFYSAYTNLGATLSDMGQDDAAVRALQTSIEIKETGEALNSLAAIKAYQKKDGEAIVLYRKAAALNPRSYICLMNLGDSCRRQGLPEEARHSYQRASEVALAKLQDDPRNGGARAYVGYLAARLGDPKRGEEEIDQALKLSPKNKTVIRRAVVTYEMLGKRGRALEIAATATPDVLRELARHPDLADFSRDPRFLQMKRGT